MFSSYSVKGLETARYRIRKKLNIEHEHNFVAFLNDLDHTAPKQTTSLPDTKDSE